MNYIGSKRRLAARIVPHIQEAIKTTGFSLYLEPFVGGASLRAAGFIAEGTTSKRPKGWDTPSRRRESLEKYPDGQKIRWSHN